MKYNILIIGIETCRKEALQCYDSRRNTSNIQKFAERSLVFDNYYTTITNTYQSWGCIFSGRYAHNSGIAILPKDKVKAKLMDSILYDNGYYSEWNITTNYKAMGKEVNYVDNLKELGEQFHEPFFFFNGYLFAHSPFGLTQYVFEKLDIEQSLNAHYKRLEELDTHFQDIIDKFSTYDNTIIILIADHGERILGYGNANHYANIEDCTTNIPLIIYHPGIKPRRVKGLFSSVDILPTILGFCGIQYDEKFEKFDGQDMSKYLLEDIPFPDRTIQLGPSIVCEEIRRLHWKNSDQSIVQECSIKKYQYSRKEVLMRYLDYENRTYVNELFKELERNDYFNDEWAKRSEVYNNLEYSHHTQYVDKIIEKLDLENNLNIVDAGAGTGMITKAIIESVNNKNLKGIEIYAIDQCYSMLNKCPESGIIKKFVADIEHLMFIPDNSIDRIVCSMVLHSEFENVDNIIKEFYRILKKGGILISAEGIPMDDSLLEFYKSFLLKKEKREVFTKQKFVDICKTNIDFDFDFDNIDLSEVILKGQSVKSWLDNTCTEEKLANEIMNIHTNADQETKEKMAMIIKDNDVLCDWKYAIVKCTK